MNLGRLLVVGVVVAMVAAGASLSIAGAAVAQGATETPNGTTDGGDGAPMGTQLTAFMQHSAGEATDTVEDGMWAAAFERANESRQAELAASRADTLDERLERLHAERERLRAQRDDGTMNLTEYASRASELNGRIDALRRGVNDTERAAERADLDVTELATLTQNASTMTGAEVAGVARGLGAAGNGPPDHAGPPTDAGRPTDAGPPDHTGPSGTADGVPNDTDAPPGGGQPDGVSGGNGPGEGNGQDDPGLGNGPPDGVPGENDSGVGDEGDASGNG